MPDVHNWQIGRSMKYPLQERHPRWQSAFVFNLNRCIGCQTCSMACKSTWTFGKGQELSWWNNVETKPHGGYPQHWDSRLLTMLDKLNPGGQVWRVGRQDSNRSPYGTFSGMTIFEAAKPGPAGPQVAVGYLPADEQWRRPNVHEDTANSSFSHATGEFGGRAELPEHRVWFFYLARLCNHCTYPACLASCPRNAIYKRPEDGIVLIDQSRCRGYRKCVQGCPYKKAMYRPTTTTSEKCIGCFPRIGGADGAPNATGAALEARCMTACVGKIRLQGLVQIDPDGNWADDPDNPLQFLVRERQVALPLYPQFGTEPNGFYIPPRWVPRNYLVQMFGPGVDHAIEQYSCPDRELLAVLQLFRTARHIIARFEIRKGPKVAEREVTLPSGHTRTQEIYNDTVVGYDRNGRQVATTTIEEPTFERPASLHVNSI
ncbi:MAG: nitrate oxidoreductase subunit beta [Planctomycetaceae bacterium]|jgi:nitrate reductase beta subunit|nr:nitrate oxidoreductase subunit beta [Planctomycetaceae bacterium]